MSANSIVLKDEIPLDCDMQLLVLVHKLCQFEDEILSYLVLKLEPELDINGHESNLYLWLVFLQKSSEEAHELV